MSNGVGRWSWCSAVLFACGLAFCTRAESIKVFALNLGQVTGQSAACTADVRSLLGDADKEVDFGCFYGPKSVGYFTITDDAYTFDAVMCLQAVGGVHVFAYRSDRYELVSRYDAVTSSGANCTVDACVVRHKASGALYGLVMPTGLGYNISGSAKINAYLKPIATMRETLVSDYPTAKVYVATSVQWGVDATALVSYLTGPDYMNLGEARVYGEDGAVSAGGIYYAPDETLTVSVANVSVSDIAEDAVVATFDYASGCTVVFKDWDGTVLSTEHVASGGSAVPPDVPTRAGYDFTGWSGSYENVTEDCVLTATYVRRSQEGVVVEAATASAFVTALGTLTDQDTLKLTADIDLTGTDYVSADLRGTVDGDGHAVSGLTTALFETVVGGTVTNLTLDAPTRAFTVRLVTGGLLANRLEGATIADVTVANGSFTAQKTDCGMASVAYLVTTNAAGRASVVTNCVARNCSFGAAETLTQGGIVGGIVGEVEGGSEIVDCRFLVDDNGAVAIGQRFERVGGIVGVSHGAVISRCLSEGRYCARNGANTAGAGGIVGSVDREQTTVVACTNRAHVSFTDAGGAVGGIVGRVAKTACRVLGSVSQGSVTLSGDAANVSSYASGVGGLVGGGWGNVSVVVVGSRNEGAVTAEDSRAAGGLVGAVDDMGAPSPFLSVSNSVNLAGVTTEGPAGGLLGRFNRALPDLAFVNCGNMGAIRSTAGDVGGIAGQIVGYPQNNDKSFAFTEIRNLMSMGTLASETGAVGKFVGRLEASERNAFVVQLGTVCFLDRTGTDLVGVVTGKEGSGVTCDAESLPVLAASAFADGTVVRKLNLHAAQEGLPLWVQRSARPDLSLFVPASRRGLILVVR